MTWCASVQMSWFTRRRSTNTSATTSTRPSASSLVRHFAQFSSGAGTLLNSKQPSIVVVVRLNNLLYSHQILYFYDKTSEKWTFINILCGYLNINIIIIWFEFLFILILVLLFCHRPWEFTIDTRKYLKWTNKGSYLFYFHMLFCN